MKLFISLISVGAFISGGLAADKPLAWPQFRGPNGSGVADGQKPPVELGPNKNVKWKIPVPSGPSSPIVAGDKLVITALDARSGSVKWEQKRQSKVSYCTPVVWNTPAGKQIAAAGHARMIGYDLKTGAEKWVVSG